MSKIPSQYIKDDISLEIVRLNNSYNPCKISPHRHSFFILMWATEEMGLQKINYRNYELKPGRVFFIHEGQVHQMINFPKNGWVIKFKHNLFQQYINRYPEQEQSGPFDYFTKTPYVQLDRNLLKHFNQIIVLFQDQINKHPNNNRLIINYLAILLFQTFYSHVGTETFLLNSLQTDQLKKLKLLIEKNYKTQRKATFYSNQIGLPTRKLNEITHRVFGKLVQEMISDRLLSECEAFLGGTNLSMKEIIFDLGFLGHSHFAYFFKKAKGQTPSEFRKYAQNFKE